MAKELDTKYFSGAVAAVSCLICGQLHDSKGKQFISIHGNICVGLHGGVVGDNLDKSGKVVRASICCLTDKCLKALIKDRLQQGELGKIAATCPTSDEEIDHADR